MLVAALLSVKLSRFSRIERITMASVKAIAAKDVLAVLPEGIMLFVGGDSNDRRHMMQRVLRNDAGRANKLVVCLTDA